MKFFWIVNYPMADRRDTLGVSISIYTDRGGSVHHNDVAPSVKLKGVPIYETVLRFESDGPIRPVIIHVTLTCRASHFRRPRFNSKAFSVNWLIYQRLKRGVVWSGLCRPWGTLRWHFYASLPVGDPAVPRRTLSVMICATRDKIEN